MSTPIIHKETDEYVFVEYAAATRDSPARRSKERKFLCLGGKFAGQRRSSFQLHTVAGPTDNGYTAFNWADRSHRRRGWKRNMLSQIWVHSDLLAGLLP